MEARAASGESAPEMIFLQNHGLFVGADSAEEIESIHNRAMDALAAEILREPGMAECPVDAAALDLFAKAAEQANGKKNGRLRKRFVPRS